METYLFDFIDQYMPLSEDEKNAIIDLDVFRSFKKGCVLLKEGDIIKGGYLVIKGCLRCYYVVDGEENTTAFYTESDPIVSVFGADDSRATHFVSCVEDSIVAVGNPEMGKEMIAKFPRFETLCLIISEQVAENTLASFADFKHSTPEQRYLNLLHNRPELLQRVPQHQIASFLGIKPQSLSRIRKRLAKTAVS